MTSSFLFNNVESFTEVFSSETTALPVYLPSFIPEIPKDFFPLWQWGRQWDIAFFDQRASFFGLYQNGQF